MFFVIELRVEKKQGVAAGVEEVEFRVIPVKWEKQNDRMEKIDRRNMIS